MARSSGNRFKNDPNEIEGVKNYPPCGTYSEFWTASQERVKDGSYVASYELKINLPEPNQTMAGLKEVSPNLDVLLPGLKGMLSSATVSPFFYQLYENKTDRLKSKMTKLNDLMTRHNFYDCETMLHGCGVRWFGW